MANRFADVTDPKTLLFEAIGLGSTCWEDLSSAGEFQSDEAKKAGEEAWQRLSELMTPV